MFHTPILAQCTNMIILQAMADTDDEKPPLRYDANYDFWSISSLGAGLMAVSERVPVALRQHAFWRHVEAHPLTACGLAISCAAVLLLFLGGLRDVFTGNSDAHMRYALFGGFAGFALTTAGALPGFFLKSLPQRIEDGLLGLAAGMMLAASSFSLILPGIKAGNTVGLGLAAGAMIFVVSNEVIPETHRNGHQKFATVGLVVGFALMMTLDTVLG
ncbi:MAG: ZIP family metal transporter [Fluviibacter sp.]